MPDERGPEYSAISDPKDFLRAKKMDLDAEAQKLAMEAEVKKLTLEAGWIGRVIGSAKNAPNNVAFLVVILVLLAGFVVSYISPTDRVEFWKIILPLLTLTLGYLFGKNSKD